MFHFVYNFETFLILRGTERIIVINVSRHSRKALVIFGRF